jgi:SSS family solute:Na+ symporter
MNLILLGVVAYVVAQLVLGLLVSARIRSEQDYLLAGRSLGLPFAAFSVFATWFGAESCVSASAKVYQHGLAGAAVDPFAYGACLLVMGTFFAAPLWKRGFTTLADLFRQRYSVGVERVAVLLMVPTSILWAAAQIRAFGQVFDSTAGVGMQVGICIGAAVAILYTATGGLRADVATDFFQGIFIIIGMIVLCTLVVSESGGFAKAFASVGRERLSLFDGGGFWEQMEKWAVPVCGSLAAQELVSRILAAKCPSTAQKASLCGGALYILVGLMPVAIGLLSAVQLPRLSEPEQLLSLLAQKHLSPMLQVFFLGALVSAILSTVDSTLLAAAALTSHNLIIPCFKQMEEKAKVNIARVGVLVAGLVALALALESDSIHELVQSASSFGSAGIFVVTAMGLFTRVGGSRAAMSAMVGATAVWCAGTWIVTIPLAYLASLFGAVFVYFTVAWFEKPETGFLRDTGGG